MEHIVEGHWKLSKNVAEYKGQDRLFMLNNVSWTLYFSQVAVSTSHRFIAILTDKVMDSHRQVILKNKYYETIFVIVQDAA